MTKPAHTRVVFSGIVGSTAAPLDEWAFGINFPADAEPITGTQAVSDGVASACADQYVGTLGLKMCSDQILTEVKVSHVGADGKIALRADGSYAQGIWQGSHAGGNAAQALPLQTALCIGLTTARSGATGKGRFFLPFPSVPISTTTKTISHADADTLAATARDFLNYVGMQMTFQPQVVSSKGYMTEVTGVRVGRVPDTMRSRRDDLPEGYSVLPLA